MNYFAINTLGCKVNQYESQQIRELLEHLGLKDTQNTQKTAQLVIINTCCVTQTASSKSRQKIRKAQRQNPDAVIFVAGCLPAIESNKLTKLDGNIHLLRNRESLATELLRLIKKNTAAQKLQNPQRPADTQISTSCEKNTSHSRESGNPVASAKLSLPQHISIRTKFTPKIKQKIKSSQITELPEITNLPPITSFNGHTRAFLKVQDGCDAHCTYCIIPKTRPKVHSKPLEMAIAEAKSLVAAGYKEIVLTGVFLGAYGQDTTRQNKWPDGENPKLAQMLDKVAQVPGLKRIRLSSLEPSDVTEPLLEVFCKHHNIMPHLHLSLQSGCDAVLKRMARQYTTADFEKTIQLLRQALDRPAVTTDLIVGFPGETDEQFQRTVDFAERIAFAKMHVFSFSAREGTAAAKMKDLLNPKVIKKRTQQLSRLDKKLQKQFRQQFIGESAEILIEDCDQLVGRAERYFKVYVKNAREGAKPGDLLKVTLTYNADDGMVGGK